MKYKLILAIFCFMLSSLEAKVFIPEISKKPGPLYQSIHLLILDEKQNAEQAWNETQHQIDENTVLLNKALVYMHNYESIIEEKLNQINNLEYSEELKKCYKKYERHTARLNRELLDNYFACRKALNSSLSQLIYEVFEEIKYIRDAAIDIHELLYVCNVTDLKRIDRESHHASVALCVLSNLAEINQHMLEAAQVVLRIFSRMNINQENSEQIQDDVVTKIQGMGSNICLDFQYLRDEFETIYENIMLCIKENM